MSAKPDYVVNTLTRPAGGAAKGGFVVNLTSSTTPMALSQPKDPTLAQYTFFVSRRREDGRERFRLHMGYFETMQAAEEMLTVVRDIYPSAWAGEAPGKKLRPNNSAAPPAPQAPQARHAPAPPAPPAAPPPRAAAPPRPVARAPVAPSPPVAAKPAPAPAPVSVAPPAPHPFASIPPPAQKPKFEEPFLLTEEDTDFRPASVPVVHPPARPAAKVVSPPPAAARPAAKADASALRGAAAAAPARNPGTPKAAAKPAPAVAKPVAAKPAAAKAAPAKPPAVAPKIAAKVTAPALTASPPQRVAAAPPQAAPKAPQPVPTIMMPAPSMSAGPVLSNVRQVLEELDELSDTQTIRLLDRHSPYREGSPEASVDEAIRVIKPEDAQSMAAIKSDVKRNAPVLFAVQLDWAVTAFNMAKVPPLAIFNAYTLYTTEANREGRTWYGLRLGFFSDAVSAKQVAYYVRSDFKSVSVVPVTTIEKERATDLNAERSGIHRAVNIKEGPTPQSLISSNGSGLFQLLEDDTPNAIEQDVDGEMSPRFFKPAVSSAPHTAAPAAPAADPKKSASNKRKPGNKGIRRDAHAQVDEETLDQTLEILGASSLEIADNNDTGVRHLRVKIDKKGSKFASLIDRLSGKK